MKAAAATAAGLAGCHGPSHTAARPKPNLVFVFADQWRAQATGYAGDPNVLTPNLDRLAAESVNLSTAVSCCPVCSPFRASLMTGRYPLTHGVFLNDLRLNTQAVSFAEALRRDGYSTAYVGKWHLDGTGRDAFTPPERRQGFEYWKALECTHNYQQSAYYHGDSPSKLIWPGYDATAQTQDAIEYLNAHGKDARPFALFLSWGPPHNPYRTGPKEWLDYYDRREPSFRDNVPAQTRDKARSDIAGYYAHITALDECLGRIADALHSNGLDRNTILVFTSDHGDMLHSQGMMVKQKPWDESIRVPFLLRCPGDWGIAPRTIDAPINAPDFMPTILGLCGTPIPETVDGMDYSRVVVGRDRPRRDSAFIACYSPFGEWTRARGGREYRGVRTSRYTYVRTLDGPWLLYDNEADPYQMRNLCGAPEAKGLQRRLEEELRDWLARTGDDFASGPQLIRRCGYRVDENDTIGYTDPKSWGQVSVPARVS